MTCFFCPHSVSLGSTQLVIEMSSKEFVGGKVRPAREADICAVVVVPNVNTKDGSPTNIPPSECFVIFFNMEALPHVKAICQALRVISESMYMSIPSDEYRCHKTPTVPPR